jgi:hypothetical protein
MAPGFYSGLQLNMFPLFSHKSTNFPITEQATCNFYLWQKDDMEQVPHWGPIILEWLVNHAVIWYFVHGALEVIINFESKGKNCNNYTENIRHHSTKFIYIERMCAPALLSDIKTLWRVDLTTFQETLPSPPWSPWPGTNTCISNSQGTCTSHYKIGGHVAKSKEILNLPISRTNSLSSVPPHNILTTTGF